MTDGLVLVLRPGAMVRPRAEGLFVRALHGERFIRSTQLAERWRAAQPALAAGLDDLPAALVTALVDAGAAALVSRQTAASTVPWHRYALSWAHDPDAAIAAVSAGRLRVTAGDLEGATVARSVAEWRLDSVEMLPGEGCTVEWMSVASHSRSLTRAVVVEPHGHRLAVRLASAAVTASRAHRLDDGAAPHPASRPDLHRYPGPLRCLAAGAALLAALALGSGGDAGWSCPVLPILVDGDDLTLHAADGWSSR